MRRFLIAVGVEPPQVHQRRQNDGERDDCLGQARGERDIAQNRSRQSDGVPQCEGRDDDQEVAKRATRDQETKEEQENKP